MEKCGRPTLPPSDDPKVQARREKAREYAQKKRDSVKQVKVETKASATINMAIKGKIARKKMADAKEAAKPPPAPPAATKKPDDNRLHNLPEDLQKKIMDITRKVWDEEGVSVNSYTMNAKDFLNFDFITYMTKREDPSGEFFNDFTYDIVESNNKNNKGIVRYKWTDDKKVKNNNYKRMIKNAKAKESKFNDWDKKNGRIIMFVLGKDDTLISYVGDISKKDDVVFAATYGKL